MSGTVKVERLVNLTVALLEARLPMTLAEIRRRTGYYGQKDAESARRMFERDKDDLRRLGVPVVTRPVGFSDDVGYLVDRSTYELPDIALTSGEVAALAAAVGLAGAESLRLTLMRLSARAPDPTAVVADPGIRLAITLPVLESLAEPLLERRCVRFDYRPANGPVAARRIDPYGIVHRRGVWYLIGRDHDRDAVRTFRLDRIASEVLAFGPGPAFDVPGELNVAAVLSGVEQGSLTVTVQTSAAMRWALEARGGRLVSSDGDTLTLQMTQIDPERDRGWLMGLSPHLTVTDPPELAEALGQSIAAVARAHLSDVDPGDIVSPAGDDAVYTRRREALSLQRPGGASADVARMLALMPWLLERPGVSVAEAAEAFGVDQTTIRRDLHHLDFCGLPGLGGGDLFEVDLIGDRIVVGMADELRRPMRPTAAEALQLVVAADAVADVLGERVPELASAVDKIRAALGVSERIADVIESVTADDPRWETLTRAIAEDASVRLQYRGRADELPRPRTVEPWRLLLDAGQWYLQGFDDEASAARTFRLDRIHEVEVTGTSRRHPMPRQPPNPRYEPTEDAISLIADVDAHARWFLEAVDVDALEDHGTASRVQLRTDAPKWIVELVLSAEGSVRVLAPTWLREAVATAAQRAQDRYASR